MRGARLVADIGGSNARFGWLAPGSRSVQQVRTLAVADHAGVADAVQAYLAMLREALGADDAAPTRAALALAGPVDVDPVALTNGRWRFSRGALREALGLAELVVLNDFEALALALPRLRPAQLQAAGPLPPPGGVKAVLGPGTGLGVACCVPAGRRWIALPGEGGHATLAAADDAEAALLALVRRHHGHVSAERLLSGSGLPLLHAAACELAGARPDPAADARSIVAGALAGDADCDRTLQHFCAMLGGFAGNLALTVGARGGVYIGGGIVPRLGERFFASRFRERFDAKGRLRGWLEQVPVAVITDTLAALDGAAAALR